MANIFLSHCSVDKTDARRLAADLKELGHQVFFDEWDIAAGKCIVTEVQRGLEAADCVVIILTPNAVRSAWVEREWKAKYWDAIPSKVGSVFPALFQDCEVPTLLRSIKYADFRTSYLQGMRELSTGLGAVHAAVVPRIGTGESASVAAKPQFDTAMSAVSALSDRSRPLSQIVPSVIELARRLGDSELVDVATYFLLGDDHELSASKSIDDMPPYKRIHLVDLYICKTGRLNPNFMGFTSAASMLQMAQSDPNFVFRRLIMPLPIVDIEERVATMKKDAICALDIPMSSLARDPKNPDHKLAGYFSQDSWTNMLLGIRRHLLAMLRKHLRGNVLE